MAGPPELTDASVGRGTVEERAALGRAARQARARSTLGHWSPPADRPDAVDLLVAQGRSRLPELLPVRYGRMSVSPFTYLRGSPVVMANDLAATGDSGLRTQLCGDAHLSNFGAFGTAERRLVFDLNDFDETLPGPFEWDVQRLCVSLLVAARTSGQGEDAGRDAATAAARSYRDHIGRLAERTELEVWYEQIELTDAMTDYAGIVPPEQLARNIEKTRHRTSTQVLGKLTEVVDGQRRIRHDPPLLVPFDDPSWFEMGQRVLDDYTTTLDGSRQVLLPRYHLVEFALKVVGVGSVATRCLIALLTGRDADDVLFLQVKEAEASVLAPHAGASGFTHHGQRVVEGQRLMQAASDPFLGWTAGPFGRHYYVRQLRDMKGTVDVDGLPPAGLVAYGELCGRVLARAHARAGDPVAIHAYLGGSDRFDTELSRFAVAYADQTERDFERFAGAVRSGELPVLEEQ